MMARQKQAGKLAGNPRTLVVDVGGSGVKMMILDGRGRPVTERDRIPTPRPATPKSLVQAILKLARRQDRFDRVSVGFPGVVRRGVVETAPNLDGKWGGIRLARLVSAGLGKPTRVANDADVQGFGAIQGSGVELVLTLGTGMGSALFLEGRLVPNLELPHHPFRRGDTYEDQLGAAALKKIGKKTWNKRLAKAIGTLDRTFNYDRLWLGGGNAKKVTVTLPPNVKIVPNVAGLLGGIALWRDGKAC
ncbi:MAG: ROK family protein [Nitrospirales bacterium]